MKNFFIFLWKFLIYTFRGGKYYWAWIGFLMIVILSGFATWINQFQRGLIITGMSDQVSWGVYIANFAFLVGVAAAAVMLVIPSYVFKDEQLKQVVILAEGLAVAACIMSLCFVVVDLGRPDRFWHIIPMIGILNFPVSMLAWDTIVLLGYLILSLGIPCYILFEHYMGRHANPKIYLPFVFISMIWAFSIHTVTAWLLSSNVSRPFWHSAILAPRFIASAFCAGPAFFLICLYIFKTVSKFPVSNLVFNRVITIVTVALQINIFLMISEVFTEFYQQTEESTSFRYLFLGVGDKSALVPWIWSSMALNFTAVIILTLRPFKKSAILSTVACVFLIIGVWIEKGMGLIVPGFIPTQLGEIFEYFPTWQEVLVCSGVWALGLLIFTMLANATLAIENGILRNNKSV